MAPEPQAPTVNTAPSNVVTREELTGALKQVSDGFVAGIQGILPRPRKTYGQYILEKRRPVSLKVAASQNGSIIQEHTCSIAEINLLNKIHRPGRYIDRRVEIVVNDANPENIEYNIRYSDAKVDQRMENAKYWRNFEELLSKVVDEQEVRDKEDIDAEEDRKEVRRMRQRREKVTA